MKTAKYLWIFGSLWMLIVGVFYIFVLSDAPAEGVERYDYILNHKGTYSFQWKSEFIIAACLAISSLIYANHLKFPGFNFVVIGQTVIAMAFPISIGVTFNADSEFSLMIGKASHNLVNFGMIISLVGFFLIHWKIQVAGKYIRLAALILAGGSFVAFFLSFVDLISSSDAQKAMVLVLVLYVLNAILAFRIQKE